MNKRLTHWIAVPIVALSMWSTSQASAICFAPEPACAVILVGGIVVGTLADEGNEEPASARITDKPGKMHAIAAILAKIEDVRLTTRLREITGNRSGLRTIVRRFEDQRHEGRTRLASLHESDPGLLDDLDELALMIRQHAPEHAMGRIDGDRRLADGRINRARYAALARHALTIRDNLSPRHRLTVGRSGERPLR